MRYSGTRGEVGASGAGSEQRRGELAHAVEDAAELRQDGLEARALGGVGGPALRQDGPVADRHVVRHRRLLPREHLEQHLRRRTASGAGLGEHNHLSAEVLFPARIIWLIPQVASIIDV